MAITEAKEIGFTSGFCISEGRCLSAFLMGKTICTLFMMVSAQCVLKILH